MSLCWMYWINADSQWQGVSIKLSTSAGFCDIFSPRLAMDLPMVGLQRSCSLDGALSLELILGTKAAMSRGMMCGTRWRSWPTSTDPRCFTTWQIWWRRTPKQNCGLYSIKVIIIVILTQLVCQFNTFANVNDFQWTATTCPWGLPSSISADCEQSSCFLCLALMFAIVAIVVIDCCQTM